MANGVEELARRMLKAAWGQRTRIGNVPEVVAPRDAGVLREIGHEDHSSEEMWRAEQWLEDRRYIVPAPVGRGSRGPTNMGAFYTVTREGHAFREPAG